MIRVTKSGKDDHLLVGACEICGCEVECQTRDTTLGMRGQDMQTIRWIPCPSCKHPTLYVKEKE